MRAAFSAGDSKMRIFTSAVTSEGRGARKRRATASVEFALIAPFLLAILLGSIEITRAIMVKAILTDAARDGARIGALPVKGNAIITNTDVTTDINGILTDNGMDTTKAHIVILVNGVSADVSTANPGDLISVQVWMYFSDVTWVRLYFLSNASVGSEFLVTMKEG
jgi:hypothetical protein